MKQCFGRLNLNWEEEGITQETVDATAKAIKKQKSLLYMLYCKYKYKRFSKKGKKEADPIKRCELLLEAKSNLDAYLYAKSARSTGK